MLLTHFPNYWRPKTEEILVNIGDFDKMPIPTTDQMVLPVLQHIADGQEHRRIDIINMLTERFSLTTSITTLAFPQQKPTKSSA